MTSSTDSVVVELTARLTEVGQSLVTPHSPAILSQAPSRRTAWSQAARTTCADYSPARIQLQALAEQVSEQDSLPVRLQEQLGALWASQQEEEEPDTPKSRPRRSVSTSSTADSTPSTSSSPAHQTELHSAPPPAAPAATQVRDLLRINTAASPPSIVNGGLSPTNGGFVRSPAVVEPEDVVALRSENSQLRAELARAGRVNELWGKGRFKLT